MQGRSCGHCNRLITNFNPKPYTTMIRTNKLNKWKRTSVCLLVDGKGCFTEITKEAAVALAAEFPARTIERAMQEDIICEVGDEVGRRPSISAAVSGPGYWCQEALDELERTREWFATYTVVFV